MRKTDDPDLALFGKLGKSLRKAPITAETRDVLFRVLEAVAREYGKPHFRALCACLSAAIEPHEVALVAVRDHLQRLARDD